MTCFRTEGFVKQGYLREPLTDPVSRRFAVYREELGCAWATRLVAYV
jgi:hypothetical protein